MKVKRNVLMVDGKEFITEERNFLRWDVTKRYYIGQSLWKYRNFLKHRLIPYSIFKREIEI